jgi:GNAT superfamily N-acetyltransferase
MSSNPNRKIFNIGEALAGVVYEPETGSVHLGLIQVPQVERRQGIGRRLLERVHEFAEVHGAKAITGSVTSIEFLRLSQSFFGDDAVTIQRETNQPYPDTTLANLNYMLKPGSTGRE